MLTFYCTRCGCRLQVDETLASRVVQCGRCRVAVRTPPVDGTLPIAAVAEFEIAEPPAMEATVDTGPPPLPVQPLDYMRAYRPSVRVPRGESVETLAERLGRVESPAESDASTMTTCPYCGSSIASFIGRCPYCRHPLHGS